MKIICSFGKVDQNNNLKKRQQEHLNELSHPFFLRTAKAIPIIFTYIETRLKVNESSMSQNCISKSLRFLKITAEY